MFRNYLICISLLFLGSCSISSSSTEPAYTPIGTSSGMELVSKNSYTIGSVDTAFQLIGPDHKIEVGGVPDPKISGITCFYSRAKTGGISGALGFAEDTSDASVSCRQTGKIVFLEPIKQTEEIWSKDTSIFFKSIQIVRFYDKNSNSLIYLVYSDKLIDGSPKNSISAVSLESIQPTLK